jgi:hypothetical protein
MLLHNFLVRNDASSALYIGNEIADNDQQVSGSLTSLTKARGNRTSDNALNVRDNFCAYFNSNKGSVPWQLQSSS